MTIFRTLDFHHRRPSRARNPRRGIAQILRNPTPGQIAIGLGLGAFVLGGLGYAAYAAGKEEEGPTPTPNPYGLCDVSPFLVNTTVLEQQIEIVVDSGEHDKLAIAAEVAGKMFPTQGGVVLVWPPGPNATPAQQCVWQVILFAIDIVFKRKGIEPGGGEPVAFVAKKALDAGYPWEEAVLPVSNYPTPGMFFDLNGQVSFDLPLDGTDEHKAIDSMDRLLQAYLGSAIVMGAHFVLQMADTELGDFLESQQGQAIFNSSAVRQKIRCSFNRVDAHRAYLQTDVANSGGGTPQNPYTMKPDDMGLNWKPWHADNKGRLAQGHPWKRTTRLDGTRLPVPNQGNRRMLLWMPALDLGALFAQIPQVSFLQWSDGRSTLQVPPSVAQVGLDLSGIDVPEVPDDISGCVLQGGIQVGP
jgi:hypothetical protein